MGECLDGKIEITWTTWTETNNDYFTVERSDNGVDFYVVSVIDGAGNSNEPLNYRIIDDVPYGATSYYRIMDTDYDGNSKYYGIIAVTCRGNTNTWVIRPNPNDGNFIIDHNGLHTFIVYDAIGRIVYDETTEDNHFKLNHLSSGEYFIRVTNYEDNVSLRLIITK